jgi:hypothetical protein
MSQMEAISMGRDPRFAVHPITGTHHWWWVPDAAIEGHRGLHLCLVEHGDHHQPMPYPAEEES